MYETLRNSYPHEVKETKWDARKKKHVHYTWKYLNDVPTRYDGRDPFLANYMNLEIQAEGAVKPGYRNCWITNKEVTEKNVRYVSECGKTRRKIENEHNNVLKNRGYNLEHNFGHGSNHAADTFLHGLISYDMSGEKMRYLSEKGKFRIADSNSSALVITSSSCYLKNDERK